MPIIETAVALALKAAVTKILTKGAADVVGLEKDSPTRKVIGATTAVMTGGGGYSTD